jgi:phosphate:Na+ symporter
VQSSSATALISSSFVSQKMIPLSAALGHHARAPTWARRSSRRCSRWTSSWLSPLLITFGVIFFLSRRNTRAGQIGRVAIGLGLIILALQLVVAATKPITRAPAPR